MFPWFEGNAQLWEIPEVHWPMIIMECSEYMYDYYSYPPMFDNQDHNKLDYSNDDDDDDVENFSEHSYAIKNQLVASKAPY